MKVVTSLVGRIDPHETPPAWPEGWPPPQVNDTITLADGHEVHVRHVGWYPVGEEDDPEPFVYIVLGTRRQ